MYLAKNISPPDPHLLLQSAGFPLPYYFKSFDFFQIILTTIFCATHIECVPVPRYDPYTFADQTWNVQRSDAPYEIAEPPPDELMHNSHQLMALNPGRNPKNPSPAYHQGWQKNPNQVNPRVARQTEPTMQHFRRRRPSEFDQEQFQSPDYFQEMIPSYQNYPALEESGYSPDLQRLMISYQMLQDYYQRRGMDLREYLPSEEMDEYDYNDILTTGPGARGYYSRSASDNANEKEARETKEQSADIDDYYDADADSEEEEEEGDKETTESSRRTFGYFSIFSSCCLENSLKLKNKFNLPTYFQGSCSTGRDGAKYAGARFRIWRFIADGR